MLNKTPVRFSLLLLLAVLIAPVSRLHAQDTVPVVTGSDPEPTGEPLVLSDSWVISDTVIMDTISDPTASTDVVTGSDPEPTGEPQGDANMLQALAIGTFISFRLS